MSMARTYTLSRGKAPKMKKRISMAMTPEESAPIKSAPASQPPRRRRGSLLAKKVQGIGGVTLQIGDSVWTREKGAYVFARATLSGIDGVNCKLTYENGNLVTRRAEELYAANPPGDMHEDHATLTNLNEPCVLDSTAKRFAVDKIYTFTGRILIAVNPYRKIDIYGAEAKKAYAGTQDAAALPPHVYSIAERAFSRMRSVGRNQAIIMSGESGAGKTETSRHIMNYLVSRMDTGEVSGLVESVLESARITEAFGNSKTRRNNNSSRFGKYMMLSFSPEGEVVAAAMQTYMLERSRVTQVATEERSYHIFYQILAAEDAPMKEATLITDLTVEKCRVLASAECPTIEDVSDVAEYELLDTSLSKVGFSKDARVAVYACMAAVLHLLNVAFTSSASDSDDPASEIAKEAEDAVEAAGTLLGCGDDLGKLLTTRQISQRGEDSIVKALSVVEAERTRDAVARTVYSMVFSWLEEQLNQSLTGDGSAQGADDEDGGELFTVAARISLLDIFGFERFPHNGFEQLCINYCNEKLQQFFLNFIFKHEQEIYDAEGVKWPNIDFFDNQGCVDAIDKVTAAGPGVLRLLESQTKMPDASDARFFEDVNRCHKASEFFKTVQKVKKRPTEAFIISHFAGDVCYDLVNGSWLERDTDKVREEVEHALRNSEMHLIKTIFSDAAEKSAGGKKGVQKITSVSKRFIKDLGVLMKDLSSGETHFVRCIKPNDKHAPRQFVPKMVLDQLRASGVFNAVELMKSGYPMRIPYANVHGKFISMMPPDLAELSPSKFTELAALACEVGKNEYALGNNQIFLKTGQGGLLEAAISLDVSTGGPVLEQHIREYQTHQAAMLQLAQTLLAYHFRWKFLRKLRIIRRVQAVYRGSRSRLVNGSVQSLALNAMMANREKVQLVKEKEKKRKLKIPTNALRAQFDFKSRAPPPADPEEVARLKTELEQAKAEAASLREEKGALETELSVLRSAPAAANVSDGMSAELAEAAAQREKVTEEVREQLKAEQQRSLGLEEELRAARAELVQSQSETEMVLERLAELEAQQAEEVEPEDEPKPQLVAIDEDEDDRGAYPLTTADSRYSEFEENDMFQALDEQFTVNITRDEVSGTLGVDIDVWQGRVTVAMIESGVPADGKLVVGDEIVGVGGVMYEDITEIIQAIVQSPDVVSLQICRRPPNPVLRAELQMCTSEGKWQFVMATLLSTRILVYELPEQAVDSGISIEVDDGNTGEINLHTAKRFEVSESKRGAPPTLSIELESGVTYLLRCEITPEEGTAAAGEKLRTWHSQMTKMKVGDQVEHNKEMVWQQGYMELSVGLDDYETCYFVLDEKFGMRIYENQGGFREGAEARQAIPRGIIGKALRSTGQSWYEFGIQIHLVPTQDMIDDGLDDTMVEARAPSHSEMLRWLATLNLRGADWHHKQQKNSGPARDSAPEAATPQKLVPKRHDTAKNMNQRSDAPGPSGKKPLAQKETTKGGRRYSSVHVVCAMPKALVDEELLGGWFSIKREHGFGSKSRFCKLIGTTTAKPNEYGRVRLVMLHHKLDPLEKGKSLDLLDVTSVKLDEKHAGRLEVYIDKRHIRMTANVQYEAPEWQKAISRHCELLRRGNDQTGNATAKVAKHKRFTVVQMSNEI